MLWYVRVQHVIMKPFSVTGWFGQVYLTEWVNEKNIYLCYAKVGTQAP